MAIPIRCISLQRCTQRRVRFDAHMRALGLDFSFFDAVDGRALCAEALAVATAARRPYFSRAMTPGEIGCYQSHVALYAETVRTGAPAMVILEDDAMVAPALTVLLEAIEPMANCFDLIWLCGAPKGGRSHLERRLTDGFDLARPFENKSTAQGYVVSLAGAEKLMRHCARMVDPIDVAIKRYWAFGGDVFNIMPSLCETFPDTETTIEGRQCGAGPKALTPLGALRHNLDQARKACSFTKRALGSRMRA